MPGKMTHTIQPILATILLCAMAAWSGRALGQAAPCGVGLPSAQIHNSQAQSGEAASLTAENSSLDGDAAQAPCASGQLFDLSDSGVKFELGSLMNTLRDSRHESWVLAAYPDPKTSRPLIGAGFSLDVKAMEHPQRDPLNPHTFIEPSSAQLWQAAGLDSERLQIILDQYERDLKAWK